MNDSLPDHLARPHVRPIQPIPVQKDGRQLVALRDPTSLQPQTMVVPVQALPMIQQLQGRHDISEIAARFKAPADQVVELVKRLDDLGLLWGPTFERLEKERWTALVEAGCFPPRASATLGEDEAACRAALDQYFDDAEDPEIEEPVRGIVAPHLDYARGWPNYAAAYFPLRTAERPDRVVILGTNHFGLGDGVVLTELGFQSPLGTCPPDLAIIGSLRDRIGRPAFVDQIDHLPEHSIDLHIPWLQYCFGEIPVVAALVPDPLRPLIEENDERLDFESFVGTMRETLDEAGGSTFFVASADLSHVGPQFGEPRQVDEQRCVDVERHDREMMSKFLDGDADEFVGAMRWNKNPTRWCSIGNMTALLQFAAFDAIELIDYRQARDERGAVMVSSAAMALV